MVTLNHDQGYTHKSQFVIIYCNFQRSNIIVTYLNYVLEENLHPHNYNLIFLLL